MSRKLDMKSFLLFSDSPLLRPLRISSRVPALPSLIVYPSTRCNYLCKMCWVKNLSDSQKVNMDLGVMDQVLRQVGRMRLRPRVHFSGLGEPLVYPDFREAIKLCGQMRMHWSLTTNGFLLDTFAEDLVANGCKGINLSIHGDAALHDMTVGIKNAYARTLKGLARLKEAKERLRVADPAVAINCVMNNYNVLELPRVLDSLLQLPVNSITFQHVGFSQSELNARADFIILDGEKLKALADFIREIKRRGFPMRVSVFPCIKPERLERYYTDANYPEKRDCILPWLSARLHPDGNVTTCGPVWGNVKNQALSAIVNDSGARGFRNAVRTGEFSEPICFRCCHRRYD